MKKLSIIAAALGVLFVGTMMFNPMAEARFGGPDCPYYGGGKGYAAQSALTEEQQVKFTKLLEAHRTATDSLHQQLAEKQAELRLITVAEKVDEGKLTSVSKEIGELRGKLMAAQIAFDKQLVSAGLSDGAGYGPHHGGRGMMMRSHGGGYGHGGDYGHGGGYGHGMRHGYNR